MKFTLSQQLKKLNLIFLETEERECLLLDEYGGCPAEEMDPSCSSGAREMTTAEIEEVVSDVEASDGELSSGDDSTDIDAVVKEYRDRIQVMLHKTIIIYYYILINKRVSHCIYHT